MSALEANVKAAACLSQSEAKEYFDALDRDIEYLVTLAESDRGFSESALSCLVEASNYWLISGALESGYDLANRIVMVPGAALSSKYTRGLLSACAFASLTGRPQEALRFARQALRDADSPVILAKAWINYGTAATNLGRNRVALSAMKRGLNHARGNDSPAERTALSNIAAIAARVGDYAAALKASEELYVSVPDDDRLRAYIEMNYGDALVHAGRLDEARTVLTKALDRFVEMGNATESARCWRTLGQLYFKVANFEDACRAYTVAANFQLEGYILDREHAEMERQLARIRDQIGEVKFFEIRMSELNSLKYLDKI
jgi:tetratricopeptide (TPR) repeat protein